MDSSRFISSSGALTDADWSGATRRRSHAGSRLSSVRRLRRLRRPAAENDDGVGTDALIRQYTIAGLPYCKQFGRPISAADFLGDRLLHLQFVILFSQSGFLPLRAAEPAATTPCLVVTRSVSPCRSRTSEYKRASPHISARPRE